MEMSWLASSKVTPGVNLDTSANDLMPCMSILAAVKALTLSVTLERLCSRRVAVTMTSPTLTGELAAAAVASAAWAWPASRSGAARDWRPGERTGARCCRAIRDPRSSGFAAPFLTRARPVKTL